MNEFFHRFRSSENMLNGLKRSVHSSFEHFRKHFEKKRREHVELEKIRKVTTNVVH